MELVLFSKHLLFLSFHTVHLMHTGAILHHFFCVFFVLMLFQHHSRSFVILGIIHWVSAKARNNCHRIHQLSCNVGRDGYYSLPFLGIKNILEPKKKKTYWNSAESPFFVILHESSKLFWQQAKWNMSPWRRLLFSRQVSMANLKSKKYAEPPKSSAF